MTDDTTAALALAKDVATEADENEVEPLDPEVVQREHEWLTDIRQMERKVAAAKEKWDDLKSQASDAKKDYDALVEQLCDTIRCRDEPGLFDTQPDEVEQDWREVDLLDIGVRAAVYEKLLDNESINTLGQLADWVEADPLRTLEDLPGVGEKTAEHIQECLDEFWASRAAQNNEQEQDDDG